MLVRMLYSKSDVVSREPVGRGPLAQRHISGLPVLEVRDQGCIRFGERAQG